MFLYKQFDAVFLAFIPCTGSFSLFSIIVTVQCKLLFFQIQFIGLSSARITIFKTKFQTRQVPVQTGPCSDRFLFRQVPVKAGPCSDRSLFRQVPVQTTPCSDRYLFRQVLVQTGTCSDRYLFRQIPV